MPDKGNELRNVRTFGVAVEEEGEGGEGAGAEGDAEGEAYF